MNDTTIIDRATPAEQATKPLLSLAGVAVVNYANLGDGIYWFQPWPWLLLNAAYNAVAMLLVGAILGAILRPAKAAVPAA